MFLKALWRWGQRSRLSEAREQAIRSRAASQAQWSRQFSSPEERTRRVDPAAPTCFQLAPPSAHVHPRHRLPPPQKL